METSLRGWEEAAFLCFVPVAFVPLHDFVGGLVCPPCCPLAKGAQALVTTISAFQALPVERQSDSSFGSMAFTFEITIGVYAAVFSSEYTPTCVGIEHWLASGRSQWIISVR